jgi:mannose-6-phosphate isomerase-like protein (cupin superfamily)
MLTNVRAATTEEADMAEVTVKKVDQMDAIFHGAFKRAGSELEVGAFGMNVLDFPPDTGEGTYPHHDHTHDDQEEVYIAWRGSGVITVDDEEIPLDGETVVRVGPGAKRKIRAGSDGLRLLALGGIPGGVYERPEVFTKGTPDPTTQPQT